MVSELSSLSGLITLPEYSIRMYLMAPLLSLSSPPP
jgi:hypothetical protein